MAAFDNGIKKVVPTPDEAKRKLALREAESATVTEAAVSADVAEVLARQVMKKFATQFLGYLDSVQAAPHSDLAKLFAHVEAFSQLPEGALLSLAEWQP